MPPSLPRLLALTVLLPSLALAGCGNDNGLSTTDTVAAGSNDRHTDGPTTAGTTSSVVVDTPLYDNLAALLDSAREQIGDVQAGLLLTYSDEAMLTYVGPSAPGATFRSTYHNGTWAEPTRIPHPTTGVTWSLDQVDPDSVRTFVRDAPGEFDRAGAEIDHVAIGTEGNDDTLGYLVSITWDDGVGSVSYGPDGQVREIKSSL